MKLFRNFKRGENGFTLIELLVVIALLGVLAAVAIPNVSKFMNKGKTEAAATELANIQTAVTAMLSDGTTGVLDAAVTTPTNDMSTVKSTKTTAGDLTLNTYLTILKADGKTLKSPNTYTFAVDGTVTQQ